MERTDQSPFAHLQRAQGKCDGKVEAENNAVLNLNLGLPPFYKTY